MKGVRKVFLAAAVMFTAACMARPLDVHVAFSTDAGNTWCGNFPTLPLNGTVKIRAKYVIADNWEKRDVITASLRCENRFASANIKRPDGTYTQRHKVYWKNAYTNGEYVWDVDTAGLAPGTHMMRMEIGYWRQYADKKLASRVTDDQVIYITIKDIRK